MSRKKRSRSFIYILDVCYYSYFNVIDNEKNLTTCDTIIQTFKNKHELFSILEITFVKNLNFV